MKKAIFSLIITLAAITAHAQTRVVVRHPHRRVIAVVRPAVLRPVVVAQPVIVARPVVRQAVVVRPARRRIVIVH
ncbi:hypothetical protein IDJ77_25825 [Mucilaginibacter sp. ZT4R22]|uniref:Uncharacterized protein n=1 Tax=Mucilaginibacter pankratovii TaxID=2772110 RepID=A0ABR7WY88_9SPHI|nr:hypothetical protein [Mucilaginibacter pankratovii]MBD1367257.1 hypothetical protein [Mucilaginibacter pankratovii]